MLRNSRSLKGFSLGARDGEIGSLKDFYFDDQNWVIRYLVADTGKWLPGRKVLISPFGVRGIQAEGGVVGVNLTREQIENSPGIEEHMPVSRQFEREYFDYYNWPYYWQGAALWGPGPTPVLASIPEPRVGELNVSPEDSHLRSMDAVAGYFIHATDGELGHVEDFIFDDANWKVRYFVIDTRNWWPGKHVLLSPEWVRDVSWERARVDVDLPKERIRSAPEYDTGTELTREYEERLHAHYERKRYWGDQLAA